MQNQGPPSQAPPYGTQPPAPQSGVYPSMYRNYAANTSTATVTTLPPYTPFTSNPIPPAPSQPPYSQQAGAYPGMYGNRDANASTATVATLPPYTPYTSNPPPPTTTPQQPYSQQPYGSYQQGSNPPAQPPAPPPGIQSNNPYYDLRLQRNDPIKEEYARTGIFPGASTATLPVYEQHAPPPQQYPASKPPPPASFAAPAPRHPPPPAETNRYLRPNKPKLVGQYKPPFSSTPQLVYKHQNRDTYAHEKYVEKLIATGEVPPGTKPAEVRVPSGTPDQTQMFRTKKKLEDSSRVYLGSRAAAGPSSSSRQSNAYPAGPSTQRSGPYAANPNPLPGPPPPGQQNPMTDNYGFAVDKKDMNGPGR